MTDPYGCHNSKREAGYYASAGMMVSGHPPVQVRVSIATYIEDAASKACQYDQRANDPRCEGCQK